MSQPCHHCELRVALEEQQTAPSEGRYINSVGEVLCGVDDCVSPWTSIRIRDIPELLRVLDTLLKSNLIAYQTFIDNAAKIREFVCVKTRVNHDPRR